MTTVQIIGLGVVALVLLVFALIGFMSAVRGTPVKRVATHGHHTSRITTEDPLFRETMELLIKVPLLADNRITHIAINGDQTYPQLWEDLRGAQHSITLQLYYCKPGRMATEIKDILVERARAGVQILFLFDAFGSQSLEKEWFDSLETAGVRTSQFRPLHWYRLHHAQYRSHIRVVTVDGRIGWTGGFGLDDKWYGDGRSPEQWRETNVRFTGPAVLQHQATFAAGWAEATGELLTGDIFFPMHEMERTGGPQIAGLMHAAPTMGSTAAERLLALSIVAARRTLWVSNAYFVPDDEFLRLLSEAAGRGVDVRILTAGPSTDVAWTRRAGRWYYERLLESGVRIYEYQPVMMHAKTFVVDGKWTSIGTMNFDNRSLALNDESNLVVWDEDVGAEMNRIFEEDLRYSREMKLEEMRNRSMRDKLVEWGAARFRRVL